MNESRLYVDKIDFKFFLQRSDVSHSEVYTNFTSAAPSKSLYTVAVYQESLPSIHHEF